MIHLMRFLGVAFLVLFLISASVAGALQWPPAGTASVRAFSFAGGPKDLITEGETLHESARPADGLLLTKEQVTSVVAILNKPSKDPQLNFMCFEPRDGLVFYKEDGTILGSLSICFTCYKSRSIPGDYPLRFDYGNLATFFASLNLEGGYQFRGRSASGYVETYRKDIERRRISDAKRAGRPLEPEPWKRAAPSDTRRLKIGDEVYLATSIPYDEFDGLKVIDAEGRVRLNLCDAAVTIAGLTEAEASAAVKAAAIKEELYTDQTRIVVVSAKPFQQGMAKE